MAGFSALGQAMQGGPAISGGTLGMGDSVFDSAGWTVATGQGSAKGGSVANAAGSGTAPAAAAAGVDWLTVGGGVALLAAVLWAMAGRK